MAAAIEFAEFHEDPALPHRWLLGWSFGTDLTLMHGLDPSIEGAILMSPPLRWSRPAPAGLDRLRQAGHRTGARARRLPQPPAAREGFAPLQQAKVVTIEGGKHLWVGETYVRRALDEIVAVVAPDRLVDGHLPTTWDGDVVSSGD